MSLSQGEGGSFDPRCRRCSRLVAYLDQIRERHPTYFSRPVPSFGVARPSLLIVGLAPGLHGANASGRPFTGDHAGILLYRELHGQGFSSAPESRGPEDGLQLHGCRITNAVRCVPPQNKPLPAEVRACNGYLAGELAQVPSRGVILALGTLAHKAVVSALGLRQRDLPFGHGSEHDLPGNRLLLDSYHCSRYNTQTGRLTQDMFRRIMVRARQWLDGNAQ